MAGASGYTVGYRKRGGSSWREAKSSSASLALTGLDAGSSYVIRLRSEGDGQRYVATGSPWAWGAGKTLFRPTVTVDSAALVVGQGVTMRAVLPAGADPVSSYRWQEGSSGKWTDMSSTKAHQSATSTTSGARVFRVVASYGSLGSASSLPVMVVWRPLGVVVSSSPAYPESGDAAKRTVTLTASSTVPTGATYQWQQWSNGGWTNLGWRARRRSRAYHTAAAGLGSFVRWSPTGR